MFTGIGLNRLPGAGVFRPSGFAANRAALDPEPLMLARAFATRRLVRDAYVAAAIEDLARKFRFQCPGWTNESTRRFNRPWFESPPCALRAVLLVWRGAAFRARNLFERANALARAKRVLVRKKVRCLERTDQMPTIDCDHRPCHEFRRIGGQQ